MNGLYIKHWTTKRKVALVKVLISGQTIFSEPAKLHVPVTHIEAGLRSFNMKMPEAINRILKDQISDLLFCPTDTAIDNIQREGFSTKPVKVMQVGDVVQDSAALFASRAQPPQCKLPQDFILATLQLVENTGDQVRLAAIVSALNTIH